MPQPNDNANSLLNRWERVMVRMGFGTAAEDAPNPAPKDDGTQHDITKSAVAISHDIAAHDGVLDHGMAVHIGCGKSRQAGALGIDAEAHDNLTLACNLADGVPLPDGFANRVFVDSSSFAYDGVDRAALMAEVKRISRDDATVTLDSALPPEFKEQNSPHELRKSIDRTSHRLLGVSQHQQIVYSCALVPGEKHISGDYITADDIRQTAHNFAINKAALVKGEHGEALEADVVETFIAPVDLAFDGSNSLHGPQTVPAGSWVLGIKVRDKDAWQKVLDGEYTGFSTGGRGSIEEAASQRP